MFDGFYVLLAAVISAFPGWVMAEFLSSSDAYYWPTVGGTCLIAFPVILLSMLEVSSPWAILSPKVITSFFRSPIAWLFFYIESTIVTGLLVFCIVWAVDAIGVGLGVILLSAPFVMIGSFTYFRLLGRLGWCLVRSARAE